MIYIENTNTDPTYNLAFEEVLFSAPDLREPVLLLWQNRPSVIIGRYQNTLEEINYDFLRENHIPAVRRNTGGGAVYHDLGNLNYSFIVPDVDSKVDFGTFTIPVVKALQAAGVDAEQSGRNDILARGRKFSGNAQQFTRHRMLHHGTLMFDVQMENVGSALKVKPGKFRSRATQSVRSRVVNLKPLLVEAGAPADMTVLDFRDLLLDWFGREYDLQRRELAPAQRQAILDLQKKKYRNPEWTYGKSPQADITRGDFFRCGEVVFHFTVRRHIIRSVKITGDFFTARDIGELESMFRNVPYDRQHLLPILEQVDLASFLGDITAEELAAVIV